MMPDEGSIFTFDDMKNDFIADEAIAAMQKLSAISRKNGNSEMSLDKINAEIVAARKKK